MPSTSAPDAVPEPPDLAPDQVPGLRERTKAKRRALIQHTAARLFAERGFEHTTLADIAEEAEVAVRTVTGYFPSKLDLATSFADEIAARLTTALAAAPGTDLIAALDAWLTEEERILDPEVMALIKAMYSTNPALGALSSVPLAEAVEAGDAALIARLGLPADHLMVELCAATLQAALGAYISSLATREPSSELHDSVMAYLGAVIDAARPSA